MPVIRNPFTWVPLYFFLLLFMVLNYKWRGFAWMLGFLITFAIANHLSVEVIKPWVQRLRPCHDPIVEHFSRMVITCGGKFSFPSAHASNHFALAMFMFLTLSRYFGRWLWVVFLWAFIISYAQVYVGAHFPGDIVGGTCVGLLTGSVTAWIYNRFIRLSHSV
jgi:undecaprenyl-diphosphatase